MTDDRGLEERMTTDILSCLRKAGYRKEATDVNNQPVRVCTYFDVNTQRQPVDCDKRGDIVYIRKSGDNYAVTVPYWRCNR